MSKSPCLVIACGGTGGHLFPGVAVAEAWEAAGGRSLLLISEKKVDAQASQKYGDLSFKTIPAIAKPATLSPKMVPFLARLWKTAQSCKAILKREDAVAVLGMGGFTSLPPVFAAHGLKLPAFVHDSNAIPGKANRATARWCDRVLLGLEAAKPYFPNSRCDVTGTPVRSELQNLPSRDDAAAKWGLDPSKKTVLVMGGSQGAKQLNTLMVEAAESIPDAQFLHLTGNADAERVEGLAQGLSNYKVLAFCDDMAAAYAVSDLSVCRSGASSLTELAYIGIPALLVPYPYAADDHQTRNADVFVEGGACRMRQESELDTNVLVKEIAEMLEPDAYAKHKAAMTDLAIKDAAQRIVSVVKEVVNA